MPGNQKRVYQDYAKLVEQITPNSDLPKGMLRSFWVGGVICVIGQVLTILFENGLSLEKESAGAFTSIALIFLGATLTGLGLYARLGTYAGGGSIVPITGFSNSIVAPAMEFRGEGLVMGVGARMFQIAGPVLVYGVGASILAGVAYYLLS